MIKASIDRQKLEKSLRRFAKDFGDNNAQAICRWGVQVCRELAMEAQPWGNKQTRKKQEGAIYADSYNVIIVTERLPRNSGNKRILHDAESASKWMDENKGEGRRTKALPESEKKITTPKILKQAVALRMVKAGIAKGGFLGAGMEIAKAQRGSDRISIGKNLFSYAQKHAGRFGSATKPRPGFSPTATLANRSAHTSLDYVLKKSSSRKAIEFGLKKTVKWYSSALRRQNQQQKP